ncbi:MAG: hypothetical protein QMD14_00355 [Candidatus Aenigmarchaeota archaeon]|nr:hypothetical protein [Candidatus Aenigmarchaeota archaeon]
MEYNRLELSREDLLKTNFIFFYKHEELCATPAGRELFSDVREAIEKGYFIRPGNVWIRVDNVEDRKIEGEIMMRFVYPKESYVLKKKVKKSWKLHLTPLTRELRLGLNTGYELLFCEEVEKLPYEFMAFDPKSYGSEMIKHPSLKDYPLGPRSKLVLFVTPEPPGYFQFASTMPEWENEICNYISKACAVNQILIPDRWVLLRIWSEKAMLTQGSVFGLIGELYTEL